MGGYERTLTSNSYMEDLYSVNGDDESRSRVDHGNQVYS